MEDLRPTSRRPSRRLAAALLCAAIGCRSAPVHLDAAPAGLAAATGSARDGAAGAPGSAVLATFEGTQVIALPAPSLAGLTREQRLLAYWLAQAGSAGDAIAYDQGYRHNLAVVRLLRGILTHPQAMPPGLLARVRDEARSVYLNRGLHDADTGRKLRPPFSPTELRVAALSAQAAGADLGLKPGTSLDAFLRELEAPLFDPSYEAQQTVLAAGAGKDPLQASANNLYEGVSLTEVAVFRERYPQNSRLAKENGKLVEQVYRAGQPGGRAPGGPREPAVAAGLYADRLARVNASLEQALRVSTGPQLQALRELELYLRTGEPEHLRGAEREWVKEAPAVDYALGFLDARLDPRGEKGLWQGVVGVVDPARTAALGKLAEALAAQQAPEVGPGRPAPLFVAVAVAAASGTGRPLRDEALRAPREGDAREGRKVLLLSAAVEAALASGPGDALASLAERRARELAPPAAAAEVSRCAGALRFARLVLRELARPAVEARPRPAERERQDLLDEVRLDLAAGLHAADPKLLELGLYPDAGCQAAAPQFATTGWSAAAGAPSSTRRRAARLLLAWFTAQGAVVEQVFSGKRYQVVEGAAQWQAAAAALSAQLAEAKSGLDAEPLRSLLDRASSPPDPRWPDELSARLDAAGLPRRVIALAPVLHPVLADGKVVDASCEPVRDLDAQLLEDWATF